MAAGTSSTSYSASSAGPSHVNFPPCPDFDCFPSGIPLAGWRSLRWTPLSISFFSMYFSVSMLWVSTSCFVTRLHPSSSLPTALNVTVSFVLSEPRGRYLFATWYTSKLVDATWSFQERINFDPSHPFFSNLSHLNLPDHQSPAVAPRRLFFLLLYIVRVPFVQNRRGRIELVLRLVTRAFPSVLPAVALLRIVLQRQPVRGVALQPLNALLRQLPFNVLKRVNVARVDLDFLDVLSPLAGSALGFDCRLVPRPLVHH
nr:hypothetical protein Iba_chr10eCG0220 [Ipomoea batatas]GME13436.1 hypothetical protein Iba_scaffold14479CG0040 [Ipomoea batatas]